MMSSTGSRLLPLLFLILFTIVTTASVIPNYQQLSISNTTTTNGGTDADGDGRFFSLPVGVAKKAGRPAKDFVREWIGVHQKWGRGVPGNVSSLFSLLDDDGRVDVEPLGRDDIFIADIEVGNPPQAVKIALDTGSSDLWMQSSDTTYQYNRKGPWAPKYQPILSNTSHILWDAEWDVRYMDGSTASGIVYLDTIRLGPFEIPNATIQAAQSVGAHFEDETGLSGIMGLAKSLPNHIRPSTPTFLSVLKSHLAAPVFAVDLRRNATGRFDFGRVDEARALDGTITWVDTDPESPHWDVQFDLLSWEGGRRTTTTTTGGRGGRGSSSANTWWFHEFKATIDTGTTLMFLPDVLASKYWFDVPGMRVDPHLSDAYTFPCHLADELPDLRIKLPKTEHVLTIPGPYLNYGPIRGTDEGYCWGGMQSADGLDVTILGDIMLKALFVAFDFEKNQVGFANKVLTDI